MHEVYCKFIVLMQTAKKSGNCTTGIPYTQTRKTGHCTGQPETRGRILGSDWDKRLKSFPTCYSQSPLLTDEQKWCETGL